jgi:hypothetical protein
VGVTNFSSSSRYRGVLSFLEKNGLILPEKWKTKKSCSESIYFFGCSECI